MYIFCKTRLVILFVSQTSENISYVSLWDDLPSVDRQSRLPLAFSQLLQWRIMYTGKEGFPNGSQFREKYMGGGLGLFVSHPLLPNYE